jgi:FKBP-type peptidyl-prolyl cis-trans isomerase
LCPKLEISHYLLLIPFQMKKFLFGMCMLAAIGAGTTACGNGAKASEDNDSLVNKATSDSLSQYYGLMAGSYIGSELSYYAKESGEDYSREEFMKGVQAVVGQDQQDAYIAGMNTGMRVLQDIKGMEKQGVQVNRDLLLSELRKLVLADSIDNTKTEEYSRTYQQMMQRVQVAAQAREEAKKAESPEAKANVKAGEAALAKVAGAKKTQSGLGYVIENPGDGDQVKAGDRVTVKYVGKHLDGSEFDKGDSSVMTPGQNLIPGFSEALELLKKGGKGTFYIPGKLAYGANGVPQAKIGPMEMLIFEIEVLDVNAPAETPDNGQVK